MVHVIIRHKVADYSRWKEAFDAHLNARKAAGEPKHGSCCRWMILAK